MSSSIISATIDENFPVAGQDNDSQGFRDNFSIIKDNFAYAKTEIEDLQTNTAKLNEDNSFANNTLSNANLLAHTQTAYDATSGISASTDVSFNSGHHFVVVAQNDITLTLTDWPTTTEYAEIRVQVYGDGVSNRTITFAGSWGSGGSSTKHTDGNAAWSGASITTGTVTSTSHLVKVFTFDSGANIFLEYLGTFTEV